MKNNIFTIKVCGIALFSLFYVNAKAQATKTTTDEKKGSQQYQTFVPNEEPKRRTQQASANNYGGTVLQPAVTTNEDDIYQGRTAEILNVLTIDYIPTDFPKYQKGKGVQWYNDQIDIYYRLHPSILKQQYRNKLGI